MRTRLRTWGLSCCLGFIPSVGAAATSAPGGVAQAETGDLAALSAKLHRLVRDPSDRAKEEIRAHIQGGLPPGALMSLLESLRAHPRSDLLGVALDLTRHRRPAIRSRAVQVLGVYPDPWRHDAVLIGFSDVAASVRAEACEIARAHPRAQYFMPLVRLAEAGEGVAAPALVAVGRLRLQGAGGAHPEEASQVLVVVEGLVDHPNPDVRAAAIELLAQQGGELGASVITKGLADPDPVVRRKVLGLVTRQPSAENFDAVLGMVRAGERGGPPAMAALVVAHPSAFERLEPELAKLPEIIRSRTIGALLTQPKFGPTRERLRLRRTLSQTHSPTSRDVLRQLAHAAVAASGGN